jgi:tRNA isopentenyl-2-thiomethyl-A-37 hydroxylase MiaE
LEPRVEEFALLEAELVTSADSVFRFHSGPPTQRGSDLSSGPS